MKPIFFILLLMLFAAQSSLAQVDFRAGPELGLWMPSLPSQNTAKYLQQDPKYTQSSWTMGGNLGFGGRMRIGKHLQVSTGLQYQIWSQRMKTTFFYRGPQLATYSGTAESQSNYQKLSIPLMVGFGSQLGKFHPFVQAGLRQGLMVHGSSVIHTIGTGSELGFAIPFEETYANSNLYSKDFNDRWVTQWIVNLGVEIGQQWMLGLHVANGIKAEKNEGKFDAGCTVAWRPLTNSRLSKADR